MKEFIMECFQSKMQLLILVLDVDHYQSQEIFEESLCVYWMYQRFYINENDFLILNDIKNMIWRMILRILRKIIFIEWFLWLFECIFTISLEVEWFIHIWTWMDITYIWFNPLPAYPSISTGNSNVAKSAYPVISLGMCFSSFIDELIPFTPSLST